MSLRAAGHLAHGADGDVSRVSRRRRRRSPMVPRRAERSQRQGHEHRRQSERSPTFTGSRRCRVTDDVTTSAGDVDRNHRFIASPSSSVRIVTHILLADDQGQTHSPTALRATCTTRIASWRNPRATTMRRIWRSSPLTRDTPATECL
jgi:hypothetical protein